MSFTEQGEMVRKTKKKPCQWRQTASEDPSVQPATDTNDEDKDTASVDVKVKMNQKPKLESTRKTRKSDKPLKSPETNMEDIILDGPFICEQCPAILKNRKTFKEHQRSHKVKTHQCKDCGKFFRYESILKEHYLLHTGEMPHTCPHCPKKFRTKSNLQRHLITHGVVSKRRSLYSSQCEVCGKILRLSSNLNAHRKSHEVERPFPCEICGKHFKTKAHLGIHMANHSEIEPYKCEECGKRFRNKSNYRKHLLIHKGDRCFKCNICDWKFVRRDQLKMHLRTHTKLFFQCMICEKQFKSEAYYKTHLSQHSKGNPFQCEVCDKSYSSNSNLKMHMKKCHGPSPSISEETHSKKAKQKKASKLKEKKSKDDIITIFLWNGKGSDNSTSTMSDNEHFIEEPEGPVIHEPAIQALSQPFESETSAVECADIVAKSRKDGTEAEAYELSGEIFPNQEAEISDEHLDKLDIPPNTENIENFASFEQLPPNKSDDSQIVTLLVNTAKVGVEIGENSVENDTNQNSQHKEDLKCIQFILENGENNLNGLKSINEPNS